MRLIFVRHGETDWNVSVRYQGQAGVSLNAQGEAQAHCIARRLRGGKIAALYASDIVRAWETACIIGDSLGLVPQAVPEWREIDVGQWEGLTPEELHERFPDHMREYESNPAYTVRLGGESYAQMQQRALVALQRIHEAHSAEETVLAVSHGGTIRSIICDILGLDLTYFGRMWLDNGSLSEIRYGARGWRLMRLNDAAHLEGLTVEGGE